jgi:lipoprotein-anchoring transpeptidase ErfK/SrfK
MRDLRPILIATAATLSLAACYEAADTLAPAADANANAVPAAATLPAITASSFPEGQAIDKAEFVEGGASTPPEDEARRVLVKAQVLLDRAHFGPGVIDGESGENFRQAVAAFEKARGMTVDGKLDAAVWRALTQDDIRPVMQDYVIAEADVRGPFLDKLPPKTDYRAMAKLEELSYTSPLEALAEKFHMDQDLLKALNPDVDFARAGTKILVAAPTAAPLPRVERIEVDKAEKELRAYDAAGKLVAIYPATVGSSDMPTPEGEWEVTSSTKDPVWNYDPAKLNFGDKSVGKLTIPAGPNNPVGVVWIDLSKDTYGIHGTPDPEMVGKTASHGCVRLTNWDARALGAAVHKGTKVVFVDPTSSAT